MTYYSAWWYLQRSCSPYWIFFIVCHCFVMLRTFHQPKTLVFDILMPLRTAYTGHILYLLLSSWSPSTNFGEPNFFRISFRLTCSLWRSHCLIYARSLINQATLNGFLADQKFQAAVCSLSSSTVRFPTRLLFNSFPVIDEMSHQLLFSLHRL